MRLKRRGGLCVAMSAARGGGGATGRGRLRQSEPSCTKVACPQILEVTRASLERLPQGCYELLHVVI